jgi:hypothetical protein
MLLRYFWEDWMEQKNYLLYPTLEDYVSSHIEKEFGTAEMEEAQAIYLNRVLQDHIPYNFELFGAYPKLLQPFLKNSKYQIEYNNGCITGRHGP